jgi:hypothetical protein
VAYRLRLPALTKLIASLAARSFVVFAVTVMQPGAQAF